VKEEYSDEVKMTAMVIRAIIMCTCVAYKKLVKSPGLNAYVQTKLTKSLIEYKLQLQEDNDIQEYLKKVMFKVRDILTDKFGDENES